MQGGRTGTKLRSFDAGTNAEICDALPAESDIDWF